MVGTKTTAGFHPYLEFKKTLKNEGSKMVVARC
jgi:hypothetical protein